jgi:hypothetical protein
MVPRPLRDDAKEFTRPRTHVENRQSLQSQFAHIRQKSSFEDGCVSKEAIDTSQFNQTAFVFRRRVVAGVNELKLIASTFESTEHRLVMKNANYALYIFH